MHLKTLTLRGFKSFASATTLQFEPGVTAVVGPNGSGKSNVVDALTWVMGEQGAKSLRGAKMEDVIFAGTAGRPPLGRAEVSLTIDNTDGALPIDYTEVTISRIMFRSGGSEYAINGTPCRLLDIQELLSDSGIGREMHVIVGQGQLDSILRATPEDRRGFVEEAAGVLKHRKRKERALRKIDGLADKLSRLNDLSGELRRQLKPLGRQAEVARRAVVIQSDVRDARLRLLADEYVAATTALEREVADEEALLHRRSELESALLAHRSEEADLAAAEEREAPQRTQAEEAWVRFTRLVDRLRGIAGVAAERQQNLAGPLQHRSGGDPDQLAASAAELRRQAEELADRSRAQQAALTDAIRLRESAEHAQQEETRQLAALRAQREQAQSEVSRWSRRVAAAEASVTARDAELARAEETRVAAAAAVLEAEQDAVGEPVEEPADEARVEELRTAFEAAKQARAEAAAEVKHHRAGHSGAQQELATLASRAETLTMAARSAERFSGDAAIAESGADIAGSAAELLQVTQGYEKAVAAAMDALADGLVVSGGRSAVAALAAAREQGTDRAEFLITGGAPAAAEDCPSPGAPLAAYVAGDEDAVQAARAFLANFVVVADLGAAADIVAAHPRWVAVTRDGDVLAQHWARGGVRDGSSALEMRAAAEEARHEADRARDRVAEAEDRLASATTAEETATVAAEQAQSRWQDARARQAALGERATQLQRRLQHAERSRQAAEERLAVLRQTQEEDAAALDKAQGQLREAEERLGEVPEPGAARQEELAQQTHAARQAETEARLALRTTQERQSAMAEQALAAERAAEAERAARAKAAADERARERRVAIAGGVQLVAEAARQVADESLSRATEQRQALRQAAADRGERLTALRAQIREVEGEIARVTDSVHRDEVARAEQRLRIEQIADRALTDHGISTDVLAAEYGPDVLVPPSPPAPGDEVDPDAPPPSRTRSTGRSRSAGSALRRSPSRCWVASTRSRWRSTRPWRSATPTSTSRSRTCRAPGPTCSGSSGTSTPAWRRSSPRRSPTPRSTSSASSRGCSREGRGDWSSPTRRTCSRRGSRWRRGRRGRRSSGCPCCPAVSAH